MQAAKERRLLDAIRTENLQTIDEFLACDSSIQLDEEINYCRGRTTPIHLACYVGNLAAVDRLIKAQADVNLLTRNGESPLFFAVQNGHLKVVNLLIKAQADFDLQQFQGASPLHIAAQDDWHDVVDHLARAQANLNLQEANGCSPLYIACQEGSSKFVKKLIKAGADVNLPINTGETPLYAAVQSNHSGVIKQLLDAYADVNLQEEDDGWAPICIASQEGYFRVVKMLIGAQADVNHKTKDGKTALFIAAQTGHHRITELLVLAQADVNVKTRNGRSSLYISAERGHRKLVQLLINAQADTNAQTRNFKSPLHAAAENGHRQIVQILINSMANPDCQTETRITPLILASQTEDYRMVQLLINSQADQNLRESSGKTALHTAMDRSLSQISCRLLITGSTNLDIPDNQGFAAVHVASKSGHCELVQALIKANADVNIGGPSGATPAYMASEENHVEVLNALIMAQADIDVGALQQAPPIYIASQNGYHEVVKTLIQAHAKVNIRVITGQTPLYIACQKGHEKVVIELLKAHADVEMQDNNGFTALYMASQFGHHDVVNALIKAQANLNVLWNFSLAPLHIAAQQNHQSTVDLLIRAQANVDIQRDTGESPLHLAVHWGHGKIVSSLVTAQAEVNLQEVQGGYSPLLIASQGGHTDIAKLLVNANASADQRTTAGKTPLHIAAQFGHLRVVELLLEARANIRARTVDWKTPLDLSIAQNHSNVASLLRDVQEKYDSDEVWETTKNTNELQSPLQPNKDSGNSCEQFEASDEFINMNKFGQPPGDTDLSLQLHAALTNSGFSDSRAAMQSAVSDVLETILQDRLNDNEVSVVGSYSEGWGNNLMRLDGRTDFESDIDIVQLMPGRLYHIRGFCKCVNAKTPPTDYSNGHIMCEGFASNPARPENGSSLRPAVDRVSACRLCCYPPIAPMQPHRVAKSNIPHPVMQSLRRELENSPCHVVHAAPPGQAGKQLRVSTTFLERRLLRSLNTVQGQLFVTLKFLVKKVIGRRVQGLKAYHAKTVTFRMLEETPAEQWRPENLMGLTRQSVQMLLDSVASSSSADNVDGRIMEHFFLSDAALYLKGADRSSFEEIYRILQDTIDHLPQLLMKFKESLKPVGDAGIFFFHPFLILPILLWNPDQKSNKASYHQIYNVVRDSMLLLFEKNNKEETLASLWKQIDRLPESACSARESLRALAYLKFGDLDSAVKVLIDCKGHEVCRGLEWPTDRTAAEATSSFVWHHLETQDSAWKFCFKFEQRSKLHLFNENFFSEFLIECFPLPMENFENFYYMNFDALLQCLRRELTPDDLSAENWIREISRRDDADDVELMIHFRHSI